MSETGELIKRLQQATDGSDAELDYLIEEATNPAVRGMSRTRNGGWWPSGEDDDREWICNPPAYTYSVDAALGLAEKLLPRWEWNVALYDGSLGQACLRAPDQDVHTKVEFAATPAIALCLAVVRVFEAEQALTKEQP